MSHNSIRTRAGLPLLVCHVAGRLRVSVRTVRWWAETGRLRGRRLNLKVWAFAEADVIEFARTRDRAMDAA